MARFYAPDAEKIGAVVVLPDEEAAHFTRVLRLRAGAAIRVFNGRGGEFDATVQDVTRNRVRALLQASRHAQAEPRVSVTLAQAALKGDKMDDVVRDAVMMGAAAVQPYVAARSEMTLATLQRGRRRDRWQRIAISAAKQCGRATVPPVLEPRLFSEIVDALSRMILPEPALMFVEPAAGSGTLTLSDLADPPPREATVVIGPEGGWDPVEIERGSAACRLVTLGARTLRADAMSLVALAALFALWKEF